MYAIVRDGGRQYRMAKGDEIWLDRLGQKVGSRIELNDVLLVGEGESVKVGKPTVAGASVSLEVLDEIKGEKLIAYMYRCKKGSSRRKKGHRQRYTRARVVEIKG
jgi:large subunit ribosomal protein L21